MTPLNPTDNPTDNRPYRPCVGIILVNPQGLVFVGDRLDTKGTHWQLPQGGIDDGETPEQSAWRELYEETGITKDKARLYHMGSDWLSYEVPDDISHKIWGGKYRGQQQKWAVFQFLGHDTDIDLCVHIQEFSHWQWLDFNQIPNHIVPFKQNLYHRIVETMGQYVHPFSTQQEL